MKFFKKINLGLVLVIIAIVLVTLYSVNLENKRSSSKEEIKKVSEEFIKITNKYSILPEQHQIIGQQNANIDLTNFYSEMEGELNNITTSKETANIQKTILSEIIQNQLLNTSSIIVNFDRKIVKISSYVFDGNQVTITFNSKITIKQKYNEFDLQTGLSTEKIKEDSFEANSETITLEQKDGTWKVVCANLLYSDIGLTESMYMF